MKSEKLKMLLRNKLGVENVIENAPMCEYTSFKAGGKAKLMIIPQNMEELQYTLFMLGGGQEQIDKVKIHEACGSLECADCSGCRGNGSRCGCSGSDGCFDNDEINEYMVIGNGSNILVRDGGYSGAIVKLGKGFDYIKIDEQDRSIIVAGASTLLSKIANFSKENSLTGFEFASGIPGSIGGAIFMNAGAYGGEISSIVEYIKVISKDGVVEKIMTPEELKFRYRHCLIQETEDVVVEVALRLANGDKNLIQEKMKELAVKRNQKQPVHLASAGSFFKRPEGNFAGALIEAAGLKGLSVGDAQVSPMHAGFIVNNGKASASEVEQLMRLVQETVKADSGIWLEPEVRIIGNHF